MIMTKKSGGNLIDRENDIAEEKKTLEKGKRKPEMYDVPDTGSVHVILNVTASSKILKMF